MTRNRLLALIAGFILIGALMAAINLLRTRSDSPAAADVLRMTDAHCDSARRACLATGADLGVEWRLGPPVRPMEQFAMQLRVTRGALGADAEVVVEFQMRDMDMGLNRYRLERGAAGTWLGRAMVPVCMSGRSDWLATLDIRDGDRHWTAELPFTVASQ